MDVWRDTLGDVYLRSGALAWAQWITGKLVLNYFFRIPTVLNGAFFRDFRIIHELRTMGLTFYEIMVMVAFYNLRSLGDNSL